MKLHDILTSKTTNRYTRKAPLHQWMQPTTAPAAAVGHFWGRRKWSKIGRKNNKEAHSPSQINVENSDVSCI